MKNTCGNWGCPQEWSEWTKSLAIWLHGRCRWRLPVLLTGLLFAQGRRTVASWLRAAGVTDGWKAYYYFISGIGRQSEWIAHGLMRLLRERLPSSPRLLFALDDTPCGWEDPYAVNTLESYADMLNRAGRSDEAAPLLERAAAIRQARPSATRPATQPQS